LSCTGRKFCELHLAQRIIEQTWDSGPPTCTMVLNLKRHQLCSRVNYTKTHSDVPRRLRLKMASPALSEALRKPLGAISTSALDWTSLTSPLIGQCLLSLKKEINSLKQLNKGKDTHLVLWLLVPKGTLRLYASIYMPPRSLVISFWAMIYDFGSSRALTQHSSANWLHNSRKNKLNMSHIISINWLHKFRYLPVALNEHKSSGSAPSAPLHKL
jgi:hypothetical protein